MASNYYPPPSFHFRVQILGLDEERDSHFQQVSGLEVQIATESRNEGGENRFEHVLPVRTRYPTLSLKRGLAVSSGLLDWCNETFSALDNNLLGSLEKSDVLIQPRDVIVSLLNEEHEPLCSWNIYHAWPKQWKLSQLDAEKSAIAIESIELQYQYFKIKK